jgi:hypothetical protein
VEDLITCPSCGGQTPADVTVCLRCFTNLESVTHRPATSTVPPVSEDAHEPDDADVDELEDDEPEGPDDEVDDEVPGGDGPGLLFPWGWQPVDAGTPLEIGRVTRNPIPEVAAHGNISRLHARIERAGDGLSVTDLDSTNGTFLNGRRLPPNVPTTAEPGDLIRFAGTLEAIVDEGMDE